MKRKVKVVKKPSYESGGMHTGDQQNYGLYRGGGQMHDYMTGPEQASTEGIRTMYPEVPRDQASIEVEKGEYIIPADMTALYKVGGKKHSQGGTPVYAKGGEYVVSDYITMPDGLQELLGFEGKTRKKKDNTIAALLGDKVDAKEYNRLSKIIQDDLSGKDVDQFELATARNRMPLYQEYVSKAAFGGEMAKALQGKDYEIPAIAQPAMEKIMMGSRLNMVEQEPLAEAKMGGELVKYQTRGKVPKSKVQEYLTQGWAANPEGTVLSRTVSSPGTLTPGKTIVIRNTGSVNDYDYVKQNPSEFPSFLVKSGWGQAPDDLARKAWETWRLTTQRPTYTPGASTTEYMDVVSEEVPGVTGSTTGTTSGDKPANGNVTIKITGNNNTGTTGGKSETTGGDSGTESLTYKQPWTSGAQPWWTQNVLQTGLLAADLFNRQRIGPWEASVDAVYPTAVFRSPRQAIAAIQSDAASARRAAALLAGPQRFAATNAAISAQSVRPIMQAEEAVNAANQNVANQLTMQAIPDVANRLAMMRADRATRLYDKNTVLSAQAREEDRMKLAALLEKGIIPGMKEAMKTSWLNALTKYPVDPRTGVMYFRGGKDLNEDPTSQGSIESDIATIERLKKMGLSGDEAVKYVIGMRSAGRRGGQSPEEIFLRLQGLI